MTEEKDIKSLRDQIPEFECIPGCTDCCGIVSFSPYEWNTLLIHQQHTTFACPYIAGDNGGCSIYDDRPIPCRLFGTVPRLACPHGKGPAQMLTHSQEENILNQYQLYDPKASTTTLAGKTEEEIYFILHSES